jgi:hypothetical protein
MSQQNDERPRNWFFGTGEGKDGMVADGRFVRFTEGPTKDGRMLPILVLEVDGEERSVWLFHEALAAKFKDEVARRASGDLVVSEPIRIEQLGRRQSATGDRSYVDYSVVFPERPTKSAREILGLSSAGSNSGDGRTADPIAAPAGSDRG